MTNEQIRAALEIGLESACDLLSDCPRSMVMQVSARITTIRDAINTLAAPEIATVFCADCERDVSGHCGSEIRCGYAAAKAVANAANSDALPPLPPLPPFNCTYADHSYPAYNKHALTAYGKVCHALGVAHAAPNAQLVEIARLIGTIFYAGNFVAETQNERDLEALLIKNGYRYRSWGEVEQAAALASLPPQKEA